MWRGDRSPVPMPHITCSQGLFSGFLGGMGEHRKSQRGRSGDRGRGTSHAHNPRSSARSGINNYSVSTLHDGKATKFLRASLWAGGTEREFELDL